MYKYILFDLDGTLTKSEEGIYNCIKYALDWAGIPYPDDTVLRSFIGPSLYDSFVRNFDMDDRRAKEMVAKYRERYNEVGLFENEVYDGVPELLRILKTRDCVMAVATSKPTEPTERILERFELRQYFDVVVGSSPDATGSDKMKLIEKVLKQMKAEYGWKPTSAFCHDTLMVGDRYYDIEGGACCGTDTAGVLYGYGTRMELEMACADHFIETPLELLELFE